MHIYFSCTAPFSSPSVLASVVVVVVVVVPGCGTTVFARSARGNNGTDILHINIALVFIPPVV